MRHRESAITAGVDVVEGREIHVEIEREAVVGAAIADLETQRGDFGLAAAALDVDARRHAPAVRLDPMRIEQFYHGALERLDQRSHAEAQSLEVDQQVDDQLSGPVISDLSAAIDLQHRNRVGAQHVLGGDRRARACTPARARSARSRLCVSAVRASVNARIARQVRCSRSARDACTRARSARTASACGTRVSDGRRGRSSFKAGGLQRPP